MPHYLAILSFPSLYFIYVLYLPLPLLNIYDFTKQLQIYMTIPLSLSYALNCHNLSTLSFPNHNVIHSLFVLVISL